MPIYEYVCQKCGEFEVTQRITEKPLGKCPTCKGKVKKLISNTSFQLKGTGWYVTDYARKGQNGEGKSDVKKDGESKKDSAAKSSSDAAKSSSESKTESKSEAKKSDSSSSTSGSDKSSSSTPSTPSTT